MMAPRPVYELPPDARLTIAGYLGVADQARAACVSRGMRDWFGAPDAKPTVLRDELRRAVSLAVMGSGFAQFPSSVPEFEWRVGGGINDRHIALELDGNADADEEHREWLFGHVVCGPLSIVNYPELHPFGEQLSGFYASRGWRQAPLACVCDIMQAEKYWRWLALSPIAPV